MITKTTGFQVDGSGPVYENIEKARTENLSSVLEKAFKCADLKLLEILADDELDQVTRLRSIAEGLLKESETIIDILTTGPKSKPKKRLKLVSWRTALNALTK